MIRTIAALCFLANVVPVAADDAAGPDTGRSLVNEFLTDVDTLTSRFEQTLIDANGEVLEVSRGTLEINRPGQFRWAFDEPYEHWLIADGLNFEENLRDVLQKGIAWYLDLDLLNGNGAGKPLGVLADPALVTVSKETGQAASTVLYGNLTNMFARLHPASVSDNRLIRSVGPLLNWPRTGVTRGT